MSFHSTSAVNEAENMPIASSSEGQIMPKMMFYVWHLNKSDAEAPVLKFGGFSLALHPDPLLPGVVISTNVPSMCRIDLFSNYQCLIGIHVHIQLSETNYYHCYANSNNTYVN